MAYVPIDDGDFRAPVQANSTVWSTLIANDAECYALYEPGLEATPKPSASATIRSYRFRWWGNYDNQPVTVGARVAASSGPQTVYFYSYSTVGVDNDPVNTVGTEDWYESAPYAAGPVTEFEITHPTPGAGTLTFYGIRAYYSAAAADTTAYASGFRKVGSLWSTSGYPVPSEVASRLRSNPIRLAKDRPVCVFAHISDSLVAVTAKTPEVWGAYDSAAWSRVGGGMVPRCDISGKRWFRVDAYTTSTTAGTAEFSVQIGGRVETWSGVGWHSWRVELSAGPHEVWGSVLPGSGNGGAIRSLLVWRTDL